MATGSSGLTYSYLLELSMRITCHIEYQILSLKVLGLPNYQVDSIWTKHQPDTNQAESIWNKCRPDANQVAYDALKT